MVFGVFYKGYFKRFDYFLKDNGFSCLVVVHFILSRRPNKPGFHKISFCGTVRHCVTTLYLTYLTFVPSGAKM